MVLVEAKRGPRGQGWWGAAIMAARREPLLGANVQGAWLGAGQPLCFQERQGSPSTAGTCGFRCSHRSGGGRERGGSRGPGTEVFAPRASTQPGVETKEAQRAAPIKTY